MSPKEETKINALKIKEQDNVATVVAEVSPGDLVNIIYNDESVDSLEAKAAIPTAHKIALREIAPGEDILKYGECIGRATAGITTGSHVHIHNIKSLRGRKSLD